MNRPRILTEPEVTSPRSKQHDSTRRYSNWRVKQISFRHRRVPFFSGLNCFRESARSAKYINTSRGPFAYADRGRGRTVRLIHGSVSDLRIWQPIFPAMARHCRVIAYSRRHHWPNPGPFDEYSFVRDVDDLAEILHVLTISSADFVAHSAGGFVAVEFAKRYPDKTISLTLFR
jgi:hypothetical protein